MYKKTALLRFNYVKKPAKYVSVQKIFYPMVTNLRLDLINIFFLCFCTSLAQEGKK